MTMAEMIKEKFNNKDYVKIDKEMVFAVEEVKNKLKEFDYALIEDDVLEYNSIRRTLMITFNGWKKIIHGIRRGSFNNLKDESTFHRELLEALRKSDLIEDYNEYATELEDITVELKA